jgi:hypothetical protein
MMNKAIASLIACTAYGVSIQQSDASGDYPEPTLGLAQVQAGEKSLNSSTPLDVRFDNETSQTVELYWLDFSGAEQSYGQIAAGQSKNMRTYATHPWKARGVTNAGQKIELDGDAVFTPDAQDGGRVIHIDEASFYQSLTWHSPVHVTFKNESSQQVELFWHNYQGNKVSYGTINAGATKAMNTYASHPWSAVALNDAGVFMSVDAEEVYVPVAGDAGRTIVIEEYESKTAGQLITLAFANESGQDVELFWHNYNGDEVSYGTIANGQTRTQGTYATHPWSVTGKTDASATLVVDGADVFVPELSDNGRTIYIGHDD